MIALLLLAGCGRAPFEPYFLDEGPSVEAVSPSALPANDAGQLARITGRGLAETEVVVVGGRNAEIVSVDDQEVVFVVPASPPGGGAVEVAVATRGGIARLEQALTFEVPLDRLIRREVASLAVVLTDCMGCGPEGGTVSVRGWVGQEQPGVALELAGLSVAQLPPIGQVAAVGPLLPTPVLYVAQERDLAIALVGARDWSLDIDRLAARRDRLYGTGLGQPALVRLFDEAGCALDDALVVAESPERLTVDATAAGAVSAWLGFESPRGDGFTATAAITTDGVVVESVESRVTARYDVDLGELVGVGISGRIGLDDLRPNELYDVVRTRGGVVEVLGALTGPPDLDVVVVDDGDVTVSVTPGDAADSVTAVELVLSDPLVTAGGEVVVLGRWLARAGDDPVVFPAEMLNNTPERAALTVRVSRHVVQAFPWDDGDLVVDLARVQVSVLAGR